MPETFCLQGRSFDWAVLFMWERELDLNCWRITWPDTEVFHPVTDNPTDSVIEYLENEIPCQELQTHLIIA